MADRFRTNPAAEDHSYWQGPRIDARPTVWVCGDESGTLGLLGSKYFVVTTARIKDRGVSRRLAELRVALQRQTGHRSIGIEFSAKNDTPTTRRAVLELIRREDLAIDATYVDKSGLPGAILDRPSRLFPLIWFDHLAHVLPAAMTPANNVTLLIASFQSASTTKAFEIAYAGACGIAWHPYGMEHLRPVGDDRLELSEPLAFLVNRVPRAPRFRTASAGSERLLQVADYASWAIQRWLERGDAEGIGSLTDKISSIRPVRVTSGEANHMGSPWLRSDHLLHEGIGDWVTWFQYDRGPTGSQQADRSIEAAVRADSPHEALRFFGLIRFEELLESRRNVLRGYLAHLLNTLPADQHPLIQSMVARVIATLVDTEHEPDRRTLETAAGILIQRVWQNPTDARDRVENAQAGQRLCESLTQGASDPSLLVENALGFAFARGLACSRSGDKQGARRAYAEVLKRTGGVSDLRLQALAARAQVNLLGLLPQTRYVRRMLELLVVGLAEHDSSLFTEPFCKASLNLAAFRHQEDLRDEEEALLSRGLGRARGVAEPWVDSYVRHVEEILKEGLV